jgi:hypothetical protein
LFHKKKLKLFKIVQTMIKGFGVFLWKFYEHITVVRQGV